MSRSQDGSPTPLLWSDFDGTAVEKLPKYNPRNWSKYPLKPLDGFVAFLGGARKVGVEFGGFVSRRPDIALRHWATRESLIDIGLRHLVADEQMIHTGSEEAKALRIVQESQRGPIGFLEDRPHRLVPHMLSALAEQDFADTRPNPITLGVVEHDNTARYIEQIADYAQATTGITGVEGSHHKDRWLSIHQAGTYIPLVTVVAVGPYSFQGGEKFATAIRA